VKYREDRHSDPKPHMPPQFPLYGNGETKHRNAIPCWQHLIESSIMIEQPRGKRSDGNRKTPGKSLWRRMSGQQMRGLAGTHTSWRRTSPIVGISSMALFQTTSFNHFQAPQTSILSQSVPNKFTFGSFADGVCLNIPLTQGTENVQPVPSVRCTCAAAKNNS
jgi:hypothetical protein